MALSFNGIDQYLQQAAVVTGVPVSFACWYQPSDLSAFRGPIGIGSKTANNGFFLLTQTAQKQRADSHANNVSSFSDSAASLSNGVWFHCVSVFGSATSRVNYLNGAASTANTVSSVPVGLTTLSVGAVFAGSSTAASLSSGLIAYPAVWNTVLSPSDVSTLYNSGSGSDPNNIEAANLRSFSYLQSGPPYIDLVTAIAWSLTGAPVVVADPFTLTPPTTSVFPVTIDTFKRIPTPATTATNLADAFDDTLSTRLQKHSDAIGATETYVFSHKGTPINILDYGADPTGVADSTTPIQNAINSLPAAGGSLYFPTGSYTISNTITLNKPGVYRGDGAYATTISTTSATLDMFNITSSGVKLSDIRFISSVTRTAGFCINTLSSGLADIFINNFLMQGAFDGINVYFTGAIRDGEILSTVTNGIGIQINFVAGAFTLIEHVIVGGISNVAFGLYGILVQGTPELTVSHCYVFYMTYGMYFNGTTNPINVVSVHHSAFDQVGYGMQFVSTASSGSIWEVYLDSLHLATAINHGVAITATGTGVVDGINISNCVILNNGATGINLMAATNVRVEGCAICGNAANGISIASGVGHFQIVGNRIGPGYTLGGNGAFAIALAGVGLNSNFIIADNDLSGNTGGEIAGTGTGTFVIANNI